MRVGAQGELGSKIQDSIQEGDSSEKKGARNQQDRHVGTLLILDTAKKDGLRTTKRIQRTGGATSRKLMTDQQTPKRKNQVSPHVEEESSKERGVRERLTF